MRKMYTMLALFVVLAVAAGCSVDNPFSDDSPSPTEPTSYLIAHSGNCVARTNSPAIVCEDRSATEPAGGIVKIEFQLRDEDGITRRTESIDITQSPPRRVDFNAVASGTWSVRHVLTDKNGKEHVRTYEDLQIF